jgi:hypothetical protein
MNVNCVNTYKTFTKLACYFLQQQVLGAILQNLTCWWPRNGIRVYAAKREAAHALNIFETLCNKAYVQDKFWQKHFGRFTTKQYLVIADNKEFYVHTLPLHDAPISYILTL